MLATLVHARPHRARLTAALLTLATLGAAGCSSQAPSAAEVAQFSAFRDVDSAPPAVKAAAAAVFRIRTANAYGTGSFVSADGQILTNNHVLGIDVCPREGCYASLTLNHQRHAPIATPVDVFVEPLHVSVGLDMAVLQAYEVDAAGRKLGKLASPTFLQIASHDAPSLVGSTVFVVGHPEGHLKKWTTGEVAEDDGLWFRASAFALPGNSGSPFLDADGHLVGLLHRAPTGEDIVTHDGINIYSVGTASAALVAAMGEDLPAGMRSIAAEVLEEDAVKNQAIYLNARALTAKVSAPPAGDGGVVPAADKSILTSLGEACDRALSNEAYSSPEELDAIEAPCFASESWIDCQAPSTTGSLPVCPDTASRAAWSARYAKIFDRHRALNGALYLGELTFAQSSLELSESVGTSHGASLLQAFLDSAHPPLDFAMAPYLAAFGITSYGGTSLLDYVHQYDHAPRYELSLYGIVNTALWLNRLQVMSYDDIIGVLGRLDADPRLTLGAKLRIEEVRHASKVID